MPKISQWTRFELELASIADYGNPVQDVMVEAIFQSPNGRNLTVNEFCPTDNNDWVLWVGTDK